MWEALGSFASAIPRYPFIAKFIFVTWLIFSASVIALAVLTYPRQEPIPRAKEEEGPEAFLRVDPATAERYSDITSSGNAGIIKILADGRELEYRQFNGGGTYYSFVRRTHEYGHGSDIALQNGKLRVGFGGLDFGYFLQLGIVPIRQVLDTAKVSPPVWLNESKADAWKFMWMYSPPSVTVEARREQSLRTRQVGASRISGTAPVLVGQSYLLRSISYQDSDVLVALYVDSTLANGDVILVWKNLQTFETPEAGGPEPQLGT